MVGKADLIEFQLNGPLNLIFHSLGRIIGKFTVQMIISSHNQSLPDILYRNMRAHDMMRKKECEQYGQQRSENSGTGD